jgi:hypothetical protein
MLKFEIVGGDSGYNEEEAIQPYDNAEDADQTIFRRPPENLRYRTEQLRKAVDNLQMTSASDRALFLLTEPATTVAWGGAKDVSGGTGIPTMAGGTGIAIVPLLSNSIRVDAGGAPSPDNTPIWAKLAKLNDTATISFTSKKYLYEDATNIAIRCYDAGEAVTGGAVVDGVEGTLDGGNPSGLVVIVVKLSNTGGGGIDATQQQVVDVINGHGTANTLVTAATTDGARLAPEIDPGERLRGGVDSECHALLQTDFNNFFLQAGYELNEGDCVVFKHADAQARLSEDATDYTGGHARLMIIRKDHELNNNPTNEFNTDVVPICKVVNDALCFVNGTGIERGETINLLPDRTLRADLAKDTVTSGDALVGAAGQTDTGSQTGSVPFSLPATSTVRDHLKRLLGDLNRHVASPTTDDYKHTYTEILNMPSIVVDAAGFGDHTTIPAAVAALPTAGGIIYIRNGTYTDAIDLTTPLATKDILLIGESKYGVILQASANKLFTIPTALEHTLGIVNMTLERTAGYEIIDANAGPAASDKGLIYIEDCYIHSSTTHTSSPFTLTVPMEVRRCHHVGPGYDTDNALGCYYFYGFTGDNYNTRLVLNQCTFYDWHVITKQENTNPRGELHVHNCEFVQCGGDPSGGTCKTLFDMEGLDRATIENCRFIRDPSNGSAPTRNACRLIDIDGTGIGAGSNKVVIRNNLFETAPVDDALGSDAAIITLPFAGEATIENNTIVSKLASAIFIQNAGLATIKGNRFIESTTVQAAGAVIIVGTFCSRVIIQNNDMYINPATGFGRGITLASPNCVIDSNRFTGFPNGGLAVYMASTYARQRITNNFVQYSGSGTAATFSLGGGNEHFIGFNTVFGGYTSCYIGTNAVRCIIIGNMFAPTDDDATAIQYFSGGNSYGMVANNICYGIGVGGAGTSYGIRLGSTDYTTVVGNNVWGWDDDWNTSGSNNGIGNTTDGYDLYHNHSNDKG